LSGNGLKLNISTWIFFIILCQWLQPRKIEDYNARLEDALARLGEVADLSDTDLQEVRAEIRHLEERLHFWREVTSTF
jgi:hypothetical protein